MITLEEIKKISTRYQIAPEMIVREYCQHNILAALISRSKPRDWHDLFFLLKNDYLSLKQKKLLPKILEKFKNYRGDIKKELKVFLPKNHQLILKDFKTLLIQELKKYVFS